jgi:hypothetical protein
MSNSFFSKYAFWFVLMLFLTALGIILFMPFPSTEAKILEKKKRGAELLGQNLIKIENIEIVDMGYYREGAITDYANLFTIGAKMLVRNNSDMKISLIRTKAKFVFRNFKTKQDGEGLLDLDIGTTIPPRSEKQCFTNLWAKYETSDLETIKEELLKDQREIIIQDIYEIWADAPSFNPFSEMISFFKSWLNT